MSRPRIAFFGSSLVSAYWNGAATYYRGVIKALHAAGYSVTFFEPDAYARQEHRDIPDPEWAQVVVYEATLDGVERALDAGMTADIVVKTSGVGVFDEWLEAAVIARRRAGMLTIFWDVDAPATLDRMLSVPDDPFRALVPKFDLILTYGGGEPVVNGYRAFGAPRCVPIYNALDPSEHYPVNRTSTFHAHLALLANRLPDREARIDEFFFKPVGLLGDRRFLLGGNGWETRPMPANVAYAGHVFTRDHNAFNSSPLAVLNVSRESMARYGYSPATRVFEAAGAGACIISDEWRGLDQFLDPGVEVLVAASGEQVAEHVEGLTAAAASAIGKAAQARVLAEHTYAHRAAQLDALLEHGGGVTKARPASLMGVR
jgi:spore maturation protein CgeB